MSRQAERPLGYAAGVAITAILILVASGPVCADRRKAAVVPATSDGLTPGTLEIVDATIFEKLPDLGYTPVEATSVPAGKAMGATKVVSTHVAKAGEGVVVRLTILDVSTGKTVKATAKTTTSGVLAHVVKLLMKSLSMPVPKPVAPVKKPAPEPAVYEPEPVPAVSEPIHGPTLSRPSLTDPQLAFVHGVWADYQRKGTAMIVAGTIATMVGVGFTVTSGVLWKRFDDWQAEAKRNQCTDCFSKGDKKIKTNAVVTGLAIASLLPGLMVLVLGVGKKSKANRFREEMAVMIPDMNLALSPTGLGGEMTLTWHF